MKELPPLPFTPMNAPGKDPDASHRGRSQGGRPQGRRRLSDHVLFAFHFACDQGDLEVAEQLITILERMLRRPPPEGLPERRVDAQPLVAAHERLWALRHSEPRDG